MGKGRGYAGAYTDMIANNTKIFGIIGGLQPIARTTAERVARHGNPGGGTRVNYLLWQRQASPKTYSQLQIDTGTVIQRDLMKQFGWWSHNPQASGGVGKGAGTMRIWGNRGGYVK